MGMGNQHPEVTKEVLIMPGKQKGGGSQGGGQSGQGSQSKGGQQSGGQRSTQR